MIRSLLLGSLVSTLACGSEPAEPPAAEEPAPRSVPDLPITPAGFESVVAPPENPTTAEKAELGRQLFFDTRLSADGTRSCYSCHQNEMGLTDGKPVAEGALGKILTRSSPPLWNIGYHTEFYWDGRSPSLEKQGMAAWTGGNMGANADEIVTTLNGIEGYRSQFQAVFGEDATPDNVIKAISAYERAFFFCADTAYDRWRNGDETAVSDAAKQGAELFTAKAGCATCHAGVLFTDLKYHNVGVGMDADSPDPGRGKITGEDADMGAFKTPTLRDITRSAPYFHNGSVATLEAAVDQMLAGGLDNPQLDRENLKPVDLTAEERSALLEFLATLECTGTLSQPTLP